MTGLLRSLALAALAALLAWTPAGAGAPEKEARAVVETLVEESHAAMAASDTPALKAAIAEAFAFDVWERFLIGDRELAEAERETVRRLLPGFLANLYSEHFGKGLEGQPEITGTRPARRDVLVEARIPRASGKPLPVGYRVRAFDGEGPKVIDVMVGGVSFLILKRDEFHALLEEGGAGRLLDFMRARTI